MMKEEREGLVNVTDDEGGVCVPQGFAASDVIAGIKISGNPDMAFIISQKLEETAAAVFTTNHVQAALVTASKKHIADGKLSAMMLNSGSVNACSGQPGIVDALEVCQKVADELGVGITEIGTCSTGLIGDQLLIGTVLAGVPELCENLGSDAAADAAAAGTILTTGSMAKQTVAHGDRFIVGAMGKGVSMVSPSMVTMLDMVTTGAPISAEMAHEAIAKADEVTFSHLDVDGSTSTNDTVITLANGTSGVKSSQEELDQAMFSVCDPITRQIQSDIEGITKHVPVTMRGTGGVGDTLVVARITDRGNLSKYAMLGSGPSWGCVLTAVGTAPVDMGPEHITVSFNNYVVCRDTGGTPDACEVDPSDKDITIEVDLDTSNPEGATIRTTDLSRDYVHINSAYPS